MLSLAFFKFHSIYSSGSGFLFLVKVLLLFMYCLPDLVECLLYFLITQWAFVKQLFWNLNQVNYRSPRPGGRSVPGRTSFLQRCHVSLVFNIPECLASLCSHFQWQSPPSAFPETGTSIFCQLCWGFWGFCRPIDKSAPRFLLPLVAEFLSS